VIIETFTNLGVSVGGALVVRW